MNKKTLVLDFVLAVLLTVTALTADTTHDVFTVADLAQLANSSDTFYLRNDLNLTNYGTWTPINFYGTFDGQGHSIKGLTVFATDTAGGLFNELHGTVRNLHVEGNITVTITSNAGAFVAHPDHPAIGNHGAVSFAHAAGVLAAYLGKEGQLFCVSTSGNVTGGRGVGGLLGGCHRNSIICDCFSTVDITYTGDNTSSCGGLVGWLAWGESHSAVIQNCYASGTVTSAADLRSNGLVGNNVAGYEAVVNSYYCNYHNPKVVDAGMYQTVEDMKQQGTYVGWDFSNVWKMSASQNDGFPYLRPPAKVAPSDVSLNMETLSLEPEDSQMLQATILPANATARHLDWYSSDTDIVELSPVSHSTSGEINARMMVNAKAPGVAVVTAVTTEGKIEAACAVTVSDGTSEPLPAYRLNGITIQDSNGKALTAIPSGSFLATVSVTNIASAERPTIMLTAYTAEGKYEGLFYVTLKSPVGGTIEATIPVNNAAGNIAQLKAFAVSSLSDLKMIGNPVSFPAT
ncbi:MAG: Ig-like domain-containing protein [Oscillibacter sp.]|nr:Ig-like domain-containing protein [Oscillibacter sp.]